MDPARNFKCMEENCTLMFVTPNELVEHLNMEHNLKSYFMEQKHMESYTDFLKWKSNFEKDTGSCYVRNWRKSFGKEGTLFYYDCKESAPYCTSHLLITPVGYQGSFLLTFCRTHYRHSTSSNANGPESCGNEKETLHVRRKNINIEYIMNNFSENLECGRDKSQVSQKIDIVADKSNVSDTTNITDNTSHRPVTTNKTDLSQDKTESSVNKLNVRMEPAELLQKLQENVEKWYLKHWESVILYKRPGEDFLVQPAVISLSETPKKVNLDKVTNSTHSKENGRVNNFREESDRVNTAKEQCSEEGKERKTNSTSSFEVTPSKTGGESTSNYQVKQTSNDEKYYEKKRVSTSKDEVNENGRKKRRISTSNEITNNKECSERLPTSNLEVSQSNKDGDSETKRVPSNEILNEENSKKRRLSTSNDEPTRTEKDNKRKRILEDIEDRIEEVVLGLDDADESGNELNEDQTSEAMDLKEVAEHQTESENREIVDKCTNVLDRVDKSTNILDNKGSSNKSSEAKRPNSSSKPISSKYNEESNESSSLVKSNKDSPTETSITSESDKESQDEGNPIVHKPEETKDKNVRKSSDIEGTGQKSSDLQDTARKSSDLEGTARKSSDLEGTARKSSDLDETAQKSSDLEGTAQKSIDLGQSAQKSSDLEGTAQKSSDLDGTARKSSDLGQSAQKSSDLEGTAQKSSDLDGTARKSSDLGQSAQKSSDLEGTAQKSSDLDGTARKSSDLGQSAQKSSDLEGTAQKSSDLDGTARKSSDIDRYNIGIEDFLFGSMSEEQTRMLKVYSKISICIDQCRIMEEGADPSYLYVLFVLEQLDQGLELPVAWLLTSRNNPQVLGLFFDLMKLRLGEFGPPRNVVTAPCTFDTWIKVFPGNTRLLYSPAYVRSTISTALSSLIPSDPGLAKAIQDEIDSVMTAKSEKTYNLHRSALFTLLENRRSCQFRDYFWPKWMSGTDLWTRVGRRKAGVCAEYKGIEGVFRRQPGLTTWNKGWNHSKIIGMMFQYTRDLFTPRIQRIRAKLTLQSHTHSNLFQVTNLSQITNASRVTPQSHSNSFQVTNPSKITPHATLPQGNLTETQESTENPESRSRISGTPSETPEFISGPEARSRISGTCSGVSGTPSSVSGTANISVTTSGVSGTPEVFIVALKGESNTDPPRRLHIRKYPPCAAPCDLQCGSCGGCLHCYLCNCEGKELVCRHIVCLHMLDHRDRDSNANRDRDSDENRDRDSNANRDRDLDANRDRDSNANRDRDLDANRDRDLDANQDPALVANRDRDLDAIRDRDLDPNRNLKTSESGTDLNRNATTLNWDAVATLKRDAKTGLNRDVKTGLNWDITETLNRDAKKTSSLESKKNLNSKRTLNRDSNTASNQNSKTVSNGDRISDFQSSGEQPLQSLDENSDTNTQQASHSDSVDQSFDKTPKGKILSGTRKKLSVQSFDEMTNKNVKCGDRKKLSVQSLDKTNKNSDSGGKRLPFKEFLRMKMNGLHIDLGPRRSSKSRRFRDNRSNGRRAIASLRSRNDIRSIWGRRPIVLYEPRNARIKINLGEARSERDLPSGSARGGERANTSSEPNVSDNKSQSSEMPQVSANKGQSSEIPQDSANSQKSLEGPQVSANRGQSSEPNVSDNKELPKGDKVRLQVKMLPIQPEVIEEERPLKLKWIAVPLQPEGISEELPLKLIAVPTQSEGIAEDRPPNSNAIPIQSKVIAEDRPLKSISAPIDKEASGPPISSARVSKESAKVTESLKLVGSMGGIFLKSKLAKPPALNVSKVGASSSYGSGVNAASHGHNSPKPSHSQSYLPSSSNSNSVSQTHSSSNPDSASQNSISSLPTFPQLVGSMGGIFLKSKLAKPPALNVSKVGASSAYGSGVNAASHGHNSPKPSHSQSYLPSSSNSNSVSQTHSYVPSSNPDRASQNSISSLPTFPQGKAPHTTTTFFLLDEVRDRVARTEPHTTLTALNRTLSSWISMFDATHEKTQRDRARQTERENIASKNFKILPHWSLVDKTPSVQAETGGTLPDAGVGVTITSTAGEKCTKNRHISNIGLC
ncbi:hypothetical protein M8J77_011115 [Diaphorina citri]|nr:hypothetical protein M8J77_011115 [Diaphorina citri]